MRLGCYSGLFVVAVACCIATFLGVRGISQIASTRRTVVEASDRLWGSPLRNLIVGVFYMLVVMAGAVIAYVLAGWSVGDALYMVIVTVYTVGYGEVQPVVSPVLRGITIGTIVLGCTGMIYLTGALVQFITLNQINQVFGIKRMSHQIERLRGHVIVCGFGRIGMMLAQGLQAGGDHGGSAYRPTLVAPGCFRPPTCHHGRCTERRHRSL